MPRCFACCQENCGYRNCGCGCHEDEKPVSPLVTPPLRWATTQPIEVRITHTPDQIGGLYAAFLDRMPFSVEVDGKLYRDMVIVSMSAGVAVLRQVIP